MAYVAIVRTLETRHGSGRTGAISLATGLESAAPRLATIDGRSRVALAGTGAIRRRGLRCLRRRDEFCRDEFGASGLRRPSACGTRGGIPGSPGTTRWQLAGDAGCLGAQYMAGRTGAQQ